MKTAAIDINSENEDDATKPTKAMLTKAPSKRPNEDSDEKDALTSRPVTKKAMAKKVLSETEADGDNGKYSLVQRSVKKLWTEVFALP